MPCVGIDWAMDSRERLLERNRNEAPHKSTTYEMLVDAEFFLCIYCTNKTGIKNKKNIHVEICKILHKFVCNNDN